LSGSSADELTSLRDNVTASERFRRFFERPTRVLAAAVAVSSVAHLVVVTLPGPALAGAEPVTMLSATITEMPPPPAPAPPKAPPVKHRSKSVARALIAAPPSDALAPIAQAQIGSEPTFEPVPLPQLASQPDKQVAAASRKAPAPPAHPIPPRLELVYRGFLGTQGFFVGDAVYRLEHEGSRYSITTVAQARGLAALFIRGEGHLASTGTITTDGLQPDIYTAERTSDGRHEAAMFDWITGKVFLNDNKTAPLVAPTFDPLAVLWQFYFVPPNEEETDFNVATTRRVYHAHFRRVGTETITLSFAEVEAEVWERDTGDGNLTARVWLAPSLHHVMVKMRLSNGRITGEALLDSIRVDDNVAQQ
jgi:hypothetical protein